MQHIFCAQPAQRKVAAVDSDQHGGAVEAQAAFGVDELVIQALAGLGVLFVLKALAHEALHHADGGDVLLHGRIQGVVVFEHPVKDVEGGHHDACQHRHQKDHSHHEDQ